MKKYAILLFTFFAIEANSQIQISIPETPKKIEFANVVVNLDEETRKIVDETVNGLLTPPNSFLDAKLERMQWYFPIIERILEEEDVPDDLKYIAVMESSLIPEALSTSSAVGYWQFKKPTGEELGLVINNDIDERKYIVASTRAAALYFKRNNLIFKNWISSIYSYNQGPTGAAGEIPEEWSYASEVNFNIKTPPYLIKALAHRIAFEHRLNRLKSSPRLFIEYPTSSKSLAEIAAELTVDISELRKYNSWLNAATIPAGKLYTVLIPVRREDADEIRSRINQRRDLVKVDVGFPQLRKSSAANAGPDAPILYDINDKKGILAQPGDEVAQLAKKGNTKIFSFLKFNDMSDRDMVKTGQVYYLQAKAKKAKVPFHTVSSEQTLWDVSQMYGVRLKQLLKYNRLSAVQRLQPGRVLWLQKKRPKNQPVEIIKEAIDIEPKKELPVVTDYTPVKPSTPEETPVIEETVPMIVEEKPIPKKVTPETTKPLIESKKEKTAASTEKSVFTNPTPSKPTYENKTQNNSKPESVITYDNKTHRVGKGETLFGISKKYGLSVNELRSLNNMSASDVLQFDQVLNVSKNNRSDVEIVRSTPSPSPPATKSAATTATGTHTVSAGETLFSISNQYGMSVDELKNQNGLNSNTISVGQRLKVNGRASNDQSVSTSSAGTYVVKAGDTLYSISKKYNTSVEKLKAWNNINSNSISVGQILEIR